MIPRLFTSRKLFFSGTKGNDVPATPASLYQPVLGIVGVGYRAVGGGLGGTVAVCVVGVIN